MKTFAKLVVLVVLLNIIRYIIGGPIESFTIMEPMHQPMIEYKDCFNSDFTNIDWASSFFYNFLVWFCAAWIFHLAQHSVSGNMIVKSFKIFGIALLFFISISAVFMNHYIEGIRTFYRFGMIDAVITFSIVALANGLLYPRFFRPKSAD